mmetsp:Transcript_22355/g.26919  ORF Transcript_22355/g.26919 Transcript_22355/m.26919 type:complete len:230 (+) Transcript_22355:277-966(+)|eukprot:CAMPEP_0197865342 /NCGR_PEP_ID=MMETSP1438-20131217/43610_1 /TAXON_ID=1461541 /ORGANISM="Pterosperma sp., Strain CCMP1384" /LENGTH=229 /DNA_ID=CAMNT_0043483795 /DNA_START=277 /DNA_END=966 /DNA_ORIENTATION=+
MAGYHGANEYNLSAIDPREIYIDKPVLHTQWPGNRPRFPYIAGARKKITDQTKEPPENVLVHINAQSVMEKPHPSRYGTSQRKTVYESSPSAPRSPREPPMSISGSNGKPKTPKSPGGSPRSPRSQSPETNYLPEPYINYCLHQDWNYSVERNRKPPETNKLLQRSSQTICNANLQSRTYNQAYFRASHNARLLEKPKMSFETVPNLTYMRKIERHALCSGNGRFSRNV